MNYVYSLRSTKNKSRHYIGLCTNIQNRLNLRQAQVSKNTTQANAKQQQTLSHGEFYLGPQETDEAALYFRDKEKAHAFERYLKTVSGRAFSKRHF